MFYLSLTFTPDFFFNFIHGVSMPVQFFSLLLIFFRFFSPLFSLFFLDIYVFLSGRCMCLFLSVCMYDYACVFVSKPASRSFPLSLLHLSTLFPPLTRLISSSSAVRYAACNLHPGLTRDLSATSRNHHNLNGWRSWRTSQGVI